MNLLKKGVRNQTSIVYVYIHLLLPLALQPSVGFGLSKNILPFFPIFRQLSPYSVSVIVKSIQLFPLLDFCNNKFFYCVGWLALRQTPNLEDQGFLFSLGHHP
jgi:hypothetical protein